MPALRHVFVRDDVVGTEEFQQVSQISDALLEYMNQAPVLAAAAEANSPGQSSYSIQEVYLEFATQLGFTSEAKGLFAEYDNSQLRPDYFFPVADSGILWEVERGKTTTNNMDLLDLWKTHICSHADHLFLMVPQELRHNTHSGQVKREYNAVYKRMGTFFHDSNYTNVKSLHLFGY